MRTHIRPQTLVEVVSEVLYHYDPPGLSQLGFPRDEYDPEAKMIIEKLKEGISLRSLPQYLYNVFVHFFSKENILPIMDECYTLIADEIWRKYY